MNVNSKIVLRIFLLLCGLFLVATAVGLGTLWLDRQAATAERNSILSTNTRDVTLYRTAESGYTSFLQVDRQANMWVGLDPKTNAQLANQTFSEVMLARTSLNQSIAQLQQLAPTPQLKSMVAQLTADTASYESYLSRAAKKNSTNHAAAQTLIFIRNDKASKTVVSNFQRLNSTLNAALMNDVSVSVNRMGSSTKYIVASDLVLLILIVIVMVLTLARMRPMEKELRESEKRYRLLFDNISDLVVMFSGSGETLMASPSHHMLLGMSEKAIHNYSIESFVHPKDVETVRQRIATASTGASEIAAFRMRTLAGETLYVEATFQKVSTVAGEEYTMMVARNISQERRATMLMEHMAYHDALTGLPNRRMFDEELRKAIHASEETPLAVVFIDLDGFKFINDTLGHVFGDEVLRLVAHQLQHHSPKHSAVFRFGGDEFVLLLQGLEEKTAVENILSKMFRDFEQPMEAGGRQVHVSLSAGISWYPFNSRDAETLTRQADMAMYQAKGHDSHSWCFFQQDFDEQSKRRFQLEEGLRNALAREEMFLVYQPLVRLNAREIYGVEALLRWRQPELGEVSPQEFIPVAEETGMIIPIGDWVLQRACEQNVEWQRLGYPPIAVSVNVSVRQMEQMDFVDKVRNALERSGLEARWLELEVTESVMADSPGRIKHLFEELKGIGVKIAIDDFGTRYSSLKYLKEFSLDILKIDKSFVDGIESSSKNASLLTTMVGLAHGLDLDAIAEGVESEDQAKILELALCDGAQGYHFGKPVKPEELWAGGTMSG